MTADGHLDDQELSALVDGDATDVERAHLEACDICTGRLRAWRRAVGRLAEVPVAPETSRDAAVRAAVASAEERTRARRGVLPWVAAAAVVLAVAGGVAAGVEAGGSGHTPTVAAGPAATTQTTVSRKTPKATGSAANKDLAQGRVGQLGDIPGVAALVTSVRSALAEGSLAPSAAANTPQSPAEFAPVSSCSPDSAAKGASVRYEARLTYEGKPAVVFVLSRTGGDEAVVLADPGCAVLGETNL